MPNAGTNAANAKETDHIPGPMPNVFEFLDPQQSSTSLVTPAAVPSDPQTPTPNAPDLSEDTQKEGLNTSLHSDSGISMPDSASEHDEGAQDAQSSDIQSKTKSQERIVSVKRRVRAPLNRSRPRPDDSRNRGEDVDYIPYPEAYYLRGGPIDRVIPPMAPQPPSRFEHESEETPEASDTESGYDTLASNLATSGVPPVYRRFAKLNHRILLHIQDEITEMEEELQFLDDAESL